MDDKEFKQRYGLQQIELQHNRSVELRRATAAFEHAALRRLFLLNGGALIVYLALFGALRASEHGEIDLYYSIAAMTAWGVGLFLSSAAITCAYYSQKGFEKAQHRLIGALDAELAGNLRLAGKRENERITERKLGHAYRKWTTFLAAVGLLAFIAGVGLGMYAVI
jgi:hypothetical protein